jgi:deazaflavin-dependent oxidoreductase (nitroreductase family)
MAGKSASDASDDDSPMNTTSTTFDAGQPRLSSPIRAIARPFGPVARRLSGSRWFPLWAILRHTGRTSGKPYATPVVARATPDGFIVPLPFGDATQWARNLFAAGGGSIRFAGREHEIADPRVVDLAEAGPYLAPPIRFAARLLGLRQFVLVRRVVA